MSECDVTIKSECENCQRLQEELDALQENTVVQSMNEMKERYEDLSENSVCRCVIDHAERSYDDFMDLLITIKTTIGGLRESIESLQNHRKYCISSTTTPATEKSLLTSLDNMDAVLKHLQFMIVRNDNVRNKTPFPQSRCVLGDCSDDE